MYLKTPQRYQSGARRRRPIISLPRLLMYGLAIGLIVVGIGIYENREMLVPEIQGVADDLMSEADQQIRQARATAVPPTEDPQVDLQLGEEAWRRGAMQDAITYYNNAMPSSPNDLTTHYRLSLAYINQGELDSALSAAEDTITANPFAADAWSIHAMALNRLDQSSAAIASALRALELVPESLVAANPDFASTRARALAFLAEAYLESGQGERANTTIEQALALEPDSYEALQVNGRIQQEVYFDFGAARENYAAAYELNPNMPYLGVWLARMDTSSTFANYESALDVYLSILEQNPSNPTALYDLGSYYLRIEGNPDEARTYYSRCVENHPDNADCHWMMARTLLDPESAFYAPEEALRLLQIANELDTQNPFYMWWLARAHNSLGQCELAVPYLNNGYRIAQANENTSLMADFEFSLNEVASCGGAIAPAVQPTETPVGTEEPDTNL